MMPKILQYVASIPEQHYIPAPEQKDKPIIYEPDWQSVYDLDTGFKKRVESVTYTD